MPRLLADTGHSPSRFMLQLLLIQTYLSQQRYLEAAKLIEGAASCVMHA